MTVESARRFAEVMVGRGRYNTMSKKDRKLLRLRRSIDDLPR